MNLEDTIFVTYIKRRGKYTKDLDVEEMNLEDTKSKDMTDS